MNTVLVINQDYSPISICTVERAFLLIFMNKADLMAEDDAKKLRSISTNFPYPSVIKIKKYINVPFRGVILTRHNIFKRDNHKCQYCGSEKDLTLDHLQPRSKGGKSTWNNLVTACKPCNILKGDQMPESIGMILRKKPTKPSYISFIKNSTKQLREDWKPFLERKATL